MVKKVREFNSLDSALHLLHRASQIADELYASSLDRNTITARQYVVLSIVANEDNPSQTDICDRSGIDRSTLADIVRRLVTRGLLARKRTREDARMYAVRMTEAGQKALEESTRAAQNVDRVLLGGFTASQRADFEAAMRAVISRQPRRGAD